MVEIKTQLRLAALDATAAPRHLKKRSGTWFVAYLVAAAVVLGIVAALIVDHKNDFIAAITRYLLPTEWQFASKLLIDNFFAAQQQVVVTNAAIVASLLVVQITLFPLKEHVSLCLEEDNHLVADPIEEHPVWFQLLEEIKLFVAMLAAQGTIFWIGYTDSPVRQSLAAILSFAVLFASIGIDFLSPILQRHKLRYSAILKSLFAHPFLLFGFGAIFALPAIGAAALAARHPEWSFGMQLGIAFGGQVVGIALAAIGGTIAGAPLVADAKLRSRSHWFVRGLAWAIMVGLVAWNVQRFYAVGSSLHHKTQILKCTYAVDWSSFTADVPGTMELLAAARTGKLTISGGFTVDVDNPTDVDVEIEDNRLELRNAGQLVATTALPRALIAAHGRATVPVRVPLTIDPSQALRIRELITTKGWTLTLFLRVSPELEFPVYILAGS